MFISDVELGSGDLFTGLSRDALMTRKDILNIYNDMKRIEYVKDECDPRSVECWYNEFPRNFFFLQKRRCCSKHSFYYRHTNNVHAFNDGKTFTQQCYVNGLNL